MRRRDITYAEFERVARAWQDRGWHEQMSAPANEVARGYFALVDGVLYRYVG